MILAFDVGNTNIVMGTIDKGKIESFVRLRTDSEATSAEYAIKIKDLLNYMKADIPQINGAVISTVVPQLAEILSEAVRGITGCDALVVSNRIDTGLDIRIDEPGSVAGDLLVGAVAGKEYYGAPAIIIDLGTATTMSVIDREGAFRGGAILPGVRLGIEALSHGTALLPEISISAPEKAVSTNTADCMRSGAVFGTADMIDGLIDRFEDELGYRCNHVATGGLASAIVSNCRHDIICDDDLLLKGLWTLYEKNSI